MKSWNEENSKLEREFGFNDFSEALAFVNKVGELAQEADHHPDILIHSYKKVRIILTTHEEGRVTQKDRDLAKKIEQMFQNPGV